MRSFDAQSVPQPQLDFSFAKAAAFTTIDLEIGSGAGLFAIRHSLQHPDRALIAIERTINKFAKFDRRRQTHGNPPNLFALHADAVAVVAHLIPVESLNEIFILYPNPYPKPKQQNLRWYNSAFTSYLLSRLKPRGRLTLATNMSYYREESVFKLHELWDLDVIEDRMIGPDESPRTHFEKKYLLRGETCWNMIFQKPERTRY